MSRQKVSVCIPVYNGEKHIRETVDSILNQTYRNYELVIVDNCSTDKTDEILKSFKDPRLKLFRNNKTVGAAQNWNKCLEHASGDYIALYHGDDIYYPTIVEEEITILDKYTKVGAVFTLAEYLNEENIPIKKLDIPKSIEEINILDFKQTINNTMRHECIFFCPTAMMRKSVLDRVGRFDAESYGFVFDLDMWLRIAQRSKLCIINKKLMKYRIYSSQGSQALAATGGLEHYKAVDKYLRLDNIGDWFNLNFLYYSIVKFIKYAAHYLSLKEKIKKILAKHSRRYKTT